MRDRRRLLVVALLFVGLTAAGCEYVRDVTDGRDHHDNRGAVAAGIA
jgi:hypothetical protein